MNRQQRRANAKLSRVTAPSVDLMATGEVAAQELAAEARLRRCLHLDGRPFFHDGKPGLAVGTVLRPSMETGIVREEGGFVHDRVFVTTCVDTARFYAAAAGGHVYQVEPFGEMDIDILDVRAFLVLGRKTRLKVYPPDLVRSSIKQFRCETARATAVLEEACSPAPQPGVSR